MSSSKWNNEDNQPLSPILYIHLKNQTKKARKSETERMSGTALLSPAHFRTTRQTIKSGFCGFKWIMVDFDGENKKMVWDGDDDHDYGGGGMAM